MGGCVRVVCEPMTRYAGAPVHERSNPRPYVRAHSMVANGFFRGSALFRRRGGPSLALHPEAGVDHE